MYKLWRTVIAGMALMVATMGATMGASSTISHAGSVSLQEKLAILKDHYPKLIKQVRGNHLVLSNDAKLVIDDGKKKNHQAKLKNPDIEDTLSQVYPMGRCQVGTPAVNFDPGRIRSDALMRHIFGATKNAARGQMRAVNWFGSKVLATKRHGTDKALEKVRDALGKLPKKFSKFYRKTAGTFNWRVIAGTTRVSVHSFGAAIDINIKYTDYWRWAKGKPGNVPRYKNKIPKEIVDIFERYGFVWGGRWYHFDTMHFEYRPELIAIGRLAEKRGCAT